REGAAEDEISECARQASTCRTSITTNSANFWYASAVPAIPSPPLRRAENQICHRITSVLKLSHDKLLRPERCNMVSVFLPV
uniref:Uncharacterized protein n=1 Tax=Aegilops tauschii subsp. strangulata TaxID=200361 RepID=A0A453LJX4_AEGTS